MEAGTQRHRHTHTQTQTHRHTDTHTLTCWVTLALTFALQAPLILIGRRSLRLRGVWSRGAARRGDRHPVAVQMRKGGGRGNGVSTRRYTHTHRHTITQTHAHTRTWLMVRATTSGLSVSRSARCLASSRPASPASGRITTSSEVAREDVRSVGSATSMRSPAAKPSTSPTLPSCTADTNSTARLIDKKQKFARTHIHTQPQGKKQKVVS